MVWSLREWLSRGCLQVSRLSANAAFKLAAPSKKGVGQEPPPDDDSIVLALSELSPRAVAMRADLHHRLEPLEPEQPKPLQGSVEERLERTRIKWE